MISANRAFCVILSSSRVSCAAESPAFANFSRRPINHSSHSLWKARFGVTPKPIRETRALPIRDRRR